MSSPSCRIAVLAFRTLRIPFTTPFRHAAAERSETASVWVEATDPGGTVGCGESCPRPYVTGETLDTARGFFTEHRLSLAAEVTDVETLTAWMAAHASAIEANPAAWCAIELAVLDLIGKRNGVPVETLLAQPQIAGPFRYTAVLGDAAPAAFHAQAERYLRLGFTDFKVKLSADTHRDAEKMSIFKGRDREIRIRADANNLWAHATDAIDALNRLAFPFFAVEEPIGRNAYDDLSAIAPALSCRIILDESFVRREQLPLLSGPPSQWIVNVRVSKMGGLIRSIQAVEAARQHRVGVIVGAQVGETSLLTRAALPVARAAADRLVAQEGAFGTFLLQQDTCVPPIMFGEGGVLDFSDHPSAGAPGLGSFSVPASVSPASLPAE